MTLKEIKNAIDAGKTVCWANDNYRVIKGRLGYLIGWDIGGRGENYTSLVQKDGVSLNGRSEDFYIKN